MNQPATITDVWQPKHTDTLTSSKQEWLRLFLSGLLLPLSFAPFHYSGFAILSMALFFAQLTPTSTRQALLRGFYFGLGFFGFGISWIYVSIHQFGHLNTPLSASITFLFIAYLAVYPAVVSWCYNRLALDSSKLFNALLFCSLWCIGELLRSIFLGGFPWLMLGFGQMDSPLQYLLPWIGVAAVSWVTCFTSTLLTLSIRAQPIKARLGWLFGFLLILLGPLLFKYSPNTSQPLNHHAMLPVSVIQANLSMRDKWDESLLWQILNHYHDEITQLLHSKRLIILPESAIPIPTNYVSDFLDQLDAHAAVSHSAILLGIPYPTPHHPDTYYNAIIGLGEAEGTYFKQHLVAFGEFVPSFLSTFARWLALPFSDMTPGNTHQARMTVDHHPIASLICYELAFPELLRRQLPQAEWIVSISDDGWFGRSLAVYQHLQMAQVLSKQTHRYQVVANNDGLSSVINPDGEIVRALPAFSQGILNAAIQPITDATLWVLIGDTPFQMALFIMLSLSLWRYRRKSIAAKRDQRYSNQPK